MKHFWQHPVTWITFFLLSCIAIFFAFSYFPRAFPLVHIDLTMDRSQALAQAKSIIKEHHFIPQTTDYVASFNNNRFLQTFVELEGGGKEAFINMITQDLYQPYQWFIRAFSPGNQEESLLFFTPNGTPYGFSQKISENRPGNSISRDQARAIALEKARIDWHIDFSHYQEIETGQHEQPSNRIDHTFVYERHDAQIAEGRYRLTLIVSGDQLTQLTRSVKIPEAFERRYASLRSANANISFIATMLMYLLYLFGGCFIGLLILLRQHRVLIRPALFWAFLISFLEFLDSINVLPHIWLNYKTALSSVGFLLSYFLSVLFSFAIHFFLYAFSFAAAESLTRTAFGNQLQLWRIWSPSIAPSRKVIGLTLGGYLVVPLFMAYVIGLYIVTTSWFGWWIPAESLFDPNILANYVPWFSALSTALKAGFWEECLFRAVPLAGAALIGAHFHRKKEFIFGAFILQAFIFGAAHATYAAQPAYARLIELIIPSFAFGAIYLAYGLLPVIIAHVIFDVVWMSLPIFIVHTATIWLHQATIIILSLTPCLIVIWHVLKKKKIVPISPSAYNNAWQPPFELPHKPEQDSPKKIIIFSMRTLITAGLISIAAIFSWPFFYKPFDATPLTVTRANAIEQARHYLQKNNINLDSSWTVLTNCFIDFDDHTHTRLQHRFVWQHTDRQDYHNLLGTSLIPPRWIIRFARFKGDIEQSAEEYIVFIHGDGSIGRFIHILPESIPGANLSEDKVRTIAYNHLDKHYELHDKTLIKEISLQPHKHSRRTDWMLIFEIINEKKVPSSIINRISLSISGDEIVDSFRFVYVPELWERAQQNKKNSTDIIAMIASLLFYLLLVIGAAGALFSFLQQPRRALRILLPRFILLLLLISGISFNLLPVSLSSFTTCQPFWDQLLRLCGTMFFSGSIRAMILALSWLFIITHRTTTSYSKKWSIALICILIGSAISCVLGIVCAYIPAVVPSWPSYEGIGCYYPFVCIIMQRILRFISLSIIGMIAICIASLIRNHYLYTWYILSFFILAAATIAGLLHADNILLMIVITTTLGIVFNALYWYILAYDYSLIPLIIAGFMSTSLIPDIIAHPYPYAFGGNIFGIVILICIAWWWYYHLNKSN